jgi:NADH:ubiquinone oxidoreductase subunit F (NADH-binding)
MGHLFKALGVFIFFISSSQAKIHCSKVQTGRKAFIKINTSKYPHENLLLTMPVTSSCTIPYGAKMGMYWLAKPGKERQLGYKCDDVAGILQKKIRPSYTKKISNKVYDLTIDIIEDVTKGTRYEIDRIFRVQAIRSGSKCYLSVSGKINNTPIKFTGINAKKVSGGAFSPVKLSSGSVTGKVRGKSKTYYY